MRYRSALLGASVALMTLVLAATARAQTPSLVSFDAGTGVVTARYADQTLYDNLSYIGTADQAKLVADRNYIRVTNNTAGDAITDGALVTQLIGEDYILRDFAEAAVDGLPAAQPPGFTSVSYTINQVQFYVSNRGTSNVSFRARLRFYEDDSPNDPSAEGGAFPGTLLQTADDYFVDLTLAARPGAVGTFTTQLVTLDLTQTASGALTIPFAGSGNRLDRIHAGLVFTNEQGASGLSSANSAQLALIGQLAAAPNDRAAYAGTSADFIYYEATAYDGGTDAASQNGAFADGPVVDRFRFTTPPTDIYADYAWRFQGDYTYQYTVASANVAPEPATLGLAVGALPLLGVAMGRRARRRTRCRG